MGFGDKKITWEEDSLGYINSQVSRLNTDSYTDRKGIDYSVIKTNSKVSREASPLEKESC